MSGQFGESYPVKSTKKFSGDLIRGFSWHRLELILHSYVAGRPRNKAKGEAKNKDKQPIAEILAVPTEAFAKMDKQTDKQISAILAVPTGQVVAEEAFAKTDNSEINTPA